jgi:hypothetical protein
MQIKNVTYKRIKNLGNYESEAVEITAEIDDDEGAISSALKLKEYVHQALGLQDEEVYEDRLPFYSR